MTKIQITPAYEKRLIEIVDMLVEEARSAELQRTPSLNELYTAIVLLEGYIEVLRDPDL